VHAPEATDSLAALVHELGRLPGIGEKSATRLAFHLLNGDASRVERLAQALLRAKKMVRLCSSCFTYTEHDLCEVCSHPQRSTDTICVVERPSDVRALEASGKFKGRYHVLHGTLSPVDGVGPDHIKAKELLDRIRIENGRVKDVTLALNPSVEGEATSLYIQRLLKPLGIRVFKIAYGLPMGGSIEYADRGTLGRALENRTEC
jgi:recombination protein RecR